MNIAHDIAFVAAAHTKKATKPLKSVRLWDKKTPYFIHPVWCALTILTETTLPAKLRTLGAQTLLYHDVLEDTNAKLPSHLSPAVVRAIRHMTFEGIEEEMRDIWHKPPEILLFKLYDKISNLLDSSWMKMPEKKVYQAYTRKLLKSVEKHFGHKLNIVRIAQSVLD